MDLMLSVSERGVKGEVLISYLVHWSVNFNCITSLIAGRKNGKKINACDVEDDDFGRKWIVGDFVVVRDTLDFFYNAIK
jgi:hypothetical protein